MATMPSPVSLGPGTEMRYKHAMILISGKSPAQILRERIELEGTLPNGALKLQTFLNHGVDCALLSTCGQHLAYRFTHATQEFTKILAPRSGVMVAQACAVSMRLPMVIAVTKPPMTSSPNAVIYKHTRPSGGVYSEETDLFVSSEVRQPCPSREAPASTIAARILRRDARWAPLAVASQNLQHRRAAARTARPSPARRLFTRLHMHW
jgi:hypothetical protein